VSIDAATLYRWSQRIGALNPYAPSAGGFDDGEAHALDVTTEIEELSAEIYEAYLDAVRAEVA
jgi:hypothetical protein